MRKFSVFFATVIMSPALVVTLLTSPSSASIAAPLDLPFTYPVTGTVGQRSVGIHDGYDMRGYSGVGSPIYASMAGYVQAVNIPSTLACSSTPSYGKHVYIRHGNNLETRYAHLDSFGPGIFQGAWVATGQLIGYEGITGGSGCDPHLHWEIKNVATGVWVNVDSQMAGVPISGPVTAQSPIGFSGVWRFRRDLGAGAFETTATFGLSGDIPITGDWDGDGYDTVGVVRYNTSTGFLDWYLSNTRLTTVVNGGYAGPFVVQNFGYSGDTPIPGNFNAASAADEKGVMRRVGASTQWYLDQAGPWGFNWGVPSDQPIVGDWDCNQSDTPGATRANGGGNLQWLLDNQIATNHDITIIYGLSYPNTQDRSMAMKWSNSSCSFPVVVRNGARDWYLSTNLSGNFVVQTFTTASADDYALMADWDVDSFEDFVSLQ